MKKIRFYLNKSFDKFMAVQFLNEKAAGIDFGKGIVKKHPQLKDTAQTNPIEKKRTINKYFNEYYKENRISLYKKLETLRDAWRKKESQFFDVTKSLFDGNYFQDGMYICYLSIVNCNPRFIESKTFQIFYEKETDDAVYAIAHELLHFAFFDFIDRKLKKESQTLSEEQIWDLSEIFNIIVLRSDLYKNIINKKFVYPYPDHKKFLPVFEKAYNQSDSIKEFVLKGIEILSKSKIKEE